MSTSLPKPGSAKAKIENLLSKQPQKWLTTAEIAQALPEISRAMVYFTMSQLTTKEKRLTRRNRSGAAGFEYQVANSQPAPQQPAPTPQAPQPVQPVPAQQQHQPSQEQNSIKMRFNEALSKAIMWTEEEKLQVARAYVLIGKDRPFLPTSERIRLAQKSLLQHRQRKYVIRKKDIPWIDKYILMAEEQDKKAQAAAFKEKAEAEKVVAEAAPEVKEVQAPASTAIDLSSLVTGEILNEVMKRATAALSKIVVDVFSSPQVREAMMININVNVKKPPLTSAEQLEEDRRKVEDRRQESNPIPRHNPVPASVDKPKRKRILIAGLINPQIREIEREFHDTLDVRFWKTDENTNVLKSKAGQADKVILVTDFISHSHEGIIQNMNVNFVRHSGGMTKLKDLLTEIYVNDKQ